MEENEILPKRKSTRLPDYDYGISGYYYVTICTQSRKCLFGKIVDEAIMLNDIGEMIDKWWLKLPDRFENVELDIYQIMPNHLHGIIVINDDGRTHGSAPTNCIPHVGVNPCVDPQCVDPLTIQRQQQMLFKIIQWFKTMTTNNYIRNVKNKNWPRFDKRLWQRNYYEHVIRNEKGLQRIQEYIFYNPVNWDKDENNPKNWKKI